MRLKVIPFKVPPDYLSVYESEITYHYDNKGRFDKKRGTIDPKYALAYKDGVLDLSFWDYNDIEYRQIDLSGFIIKAINVETREVFPISKLETHSNVIILSRYWFSPETQNLFTNNLDDLKPILTYLEKHPYLNDLYKDLNSQLYFPKNQRIIKDLFSDSLARKPKRDGDNFFLLQVILIKLIYFIFQIEYGDWDFTTTNTRVGRYFEFLNPNLIKNIDSDDVLNRNIHNLPVPENSFLLRREHLYLNKEVILPIVNIKKYLTLSNKEQDSFYDLFKFSKDTRFRYCNYNPERDLALLSTEITNNSQEKITVFVFCKFNHLKYQTFCDRRILPQLRDDECYEFMDINSNQNNIDFLNLINRKRTWPTYWEYKCFGLSKKTIVKLIRKSGLKFNKENYPSVFNFNWVSDKGSLVTEKNNTEPITVLSQIIENKFWDPVELRFHYTRDTIDRDAVINGYYIEQKLIGFKVKDSDGKIRESKVGNVLFPNSSNLMTFYYSLNPIYFRTDFEPLRVDILMNIINSKRYDPNSYIFGIIPYSIWILLYCDLFNQLVLKKKKNRLLIESETDSDIIDEIRPKIVNRLKTEKTSQAGPSSGWLRKRYKEYQKQHQEYSDKMIKPSLKDKFVYSQSYEPYHYG